MNILVKNPDATISICDKIAENNKKLSDACTQLQKCLNQINSNWQSNGVEKQSYVIDLEKQLSNISYLNSSIENVTSSIRSYSQNNKDLNPIKKEEE